MDNKKLFPKDFSPFNKKQKEWLSGFLSGLKTQFLHQNNHTNNENVTKLHILYGTQTGNSESIAHNLAHSAEKNNINPIVKSMEDISIKDFANITNLAIIISTYGEGEMPDSAEILWEEISKKNDLNLSHLQYSILSLGDSSYTYFCLAGKNWDERLTKLKAKTIIPRVDCDVDFEKLSQKWSNDLISYFATDTIVKVHSQSPSNYSSKKPFITTLKDKKLLSKNGSGKEIWHYEIHLTDELAYEAGDCLGVIPCNSDELVNNIIEILELNTSENIHGKSLFEHLKFDYEIRQPNKKFLNYLMTHSNDGELIKQLNQEDPKLVSDFLWGKETLNFLKSYPKLRISADELLSLFSPLKARIYSISSSYKALPEQVHLTIASVRYNTDKINHNGVCSTFLSDIITIDDELQVYLVKNKHFKIPTDPNQKMIMVGPGTGLAPFRAFIQERNFHKAPGENWLFFGDRNKEFDFIYREEIEEWLNTKQLHRLELAFSRDQKEKIYVQTQMLANGKELFSWLEQGAYFYICGDAKYMAKDVDNALHKIIEAHGKLSSNDAIEYVNQLKKNKRYLRDVY